MGPPLAQVPYLCSEGGGVLAASPSTRTPSALRLPRDSTRQPQPSSQQTGPPAPPGAQVCLLMWGGNNNNAQVLSGPAPPSRLGSLLPGQNQIQLVPLVYLTCYPAASMQTDPNRSLLTGSGSALLFPAAEAGRKVLVHVTHLISISSYGR